MADFAALVDADFALEEGVFGVEAEVALAAVGRGEASSAGGEEGGFVVDIAELEEGVLHGAVHEVGGHGGEVIVAREDGAAGGGGEVEASGVAVEVDAGGGVGGGEALEALEVVGCGGVDGCEVEAARG